MINYNMLALKCGQEEQLHNIAPALTQRFLDRLGAESQFRNR